MVAGLYALLGEVYGKLDPDRLRRIMVSTAKPLPWHDGKVAHPEILAPVAQQGGGIVQAWNAAHTMAELDVDSLMLNDTDHFAGNKTFNVRNTGSADLVLELSHRKAVTMYTMQPGLDVLQASHFPNPIVEDWADVQLSSEYVISTSNPTSISRTNTLPAKSPFPQAALPA
jgi:hypothetical protein